MLTGKLRRLPLAFCMLCVIAYGQEMKLEPGKAVERKIAGGESHTYQISLAARQFVRYSQIKDLNRAPLDPNFQGCGVQVTHLRLRTYSRNEK